MSMYGKEVVIDGIRCGIVIRGTQNGNYNCIFEREFATLEQLEAINWAQPTFTDKKNSCILPEGYGFEVKNISYSSATKSFTVEIATGKQFLGDVTDYVNQVEELNQQIDAKNAEIAEKNSTITELTNANTALNEQLIQAVAEKESVEKEDTGTEEVVESK